MTAYCAKVKHNLILTNIRLKLDYLQSNFLILTTEDDNWCPVLDCKNAK